MSDLPYRHSSEVWQESRAEMLNPPQGVMLPWWPQFSELILGLRPHEITLVCAPTGAGKTSFLSQITTQLLIQGVSSFAAPVETGDSDYMKRVASPIAKMDLNTGVAIQESTLREVEGLLLPYLKRTLLNISTYDNRVAVDEIVSLIKYQAQNYGTKVVLLDNLNFFLPVTSEQGVTAAIDEAIHDLVILKKRVPVHILLVVHPRKTEGGRVESEFDIKGSSTAVQECDNVLLFNRPKPEDVESGRRSWADRELVFKKIRKRGHNVNRPVWLTWQFGQYKEVLNNPPKKASKQTNWLDND